MDKSCKNRVARIGWALAFFMPILIVMCGYIAAGIAPFGKYCLLSMDAWGQYFPMLMEMKHAVRSGFSRGFFEGIKSFAGGWSPNGALGFNRYAQNMYYTNSPLWAILYVLPDGAMIIGVDLLVMLRAGLAGVTCNYYLTRRYHTVRGERESHEILQDNDDKLKCYLGVCGRAAFCCAYACCGWYLAFVNQFMWADAYVLFPLVVLGIERIAQGGGRKLELMYILPLALTVISCFYIGYMVCLFCVLYFLLLLFCGENKFVLRTAQTLRPLAAPDGHAIRAGVKSRIRLCVNFAVNSLLAGGLSAISWLPAVFALRETISAGADWGGTVEMYHNLWEILGRFLPFMKVSLVYEAPNLYCGIVCVLLCAGAVFWPRRKAIAHGIFFVFLIVSFNLNILDYVWHGFHYPHQLPGRWSFMPIFLIVACAYGVWEKMRRNGPTVAAVVAIIIFAEVAANAICCFGMQIRVVGAEEFVAFDAAMGEALGTIREREGNNFYRVELEKPYNFNSGQLYGYPGISYYSSTMTKAAYDFFGELGMPIYAKNLSTRYEPEAGYDGMFGVKYILKTSGLFLRDGKLVGDVEVKENENVLPVGTVIKGSTKDLDEWWKSCHKKTGGRRFAELKRKIAGTGEWRYDGADCITGYVYADVRESDDAVILITVPYDRGFTVTVDGEHAELKKVFGYLCAVKISAGEHYVKLTYAVPGLAYAAVLFCISLLVIIWVTCYNILDQLRAKQAFWT